MANNAITLHCACGEKMELAREMLGHIFPCPACGRNVRVSLQFLMLDQEVAPNLTAVCTCGRFIVAKPNKAGKKVTCNVCGRRVALPQPVKDKKGHGPTRIHPRALEKQLRKARQHAKQEDRSETTRDQPSVRQTGPFSLKPGQQVCIDSDCKMPLPPGANICTRCCLNQTTGNRYSSPGPENDPVGSWNIKWVRE